MPTKKSNNGKVQPKSDAADDLRSLFEEQLKDIYWAEKALTKALPKMAKNASAPQLVEAINEHLEVTKQQVQKVEQVFEAIGKKAQAKKCDAMEGLLKEGEGIVEETTPGPVRDAGIIGACQKVEHYEIASYGTLASFASLLGEAEAAEILEEILAEEKEADSTLTSVAQSAINAEALQGDEGEDDEEDDDEEEEEPANSRAAGRNAAPKKAAAKKAGSGKAAPKKAAKKK
ncbi:MAG: ferritin-like domain-containing protein [Chitinophagaceae bacterium]|nr:MAG: ferritin-like domain-containing protein [Chitinophagaceae bacterium]